MTRAAQVLKTQGQDCPTAITFSGNGSRYIDEYLTGDTGLLQDITLLVLKAVLKDVPDTIQLLLPRGTEGEYLLRWSLQK